MAREIRDMESLRKALMPAVEAAIGHAADGAKAEVDKAISRYYAEYSPKEYERTSQLLASCKTVKQRQRGWQARAGVRLALDGMSYKGGNDGYGPLEVALSADEGLHGGWDTGDIKAGQASAAKVRSSAGRALGGGTRILSEPMEALINGGKAAVALGEGLRKARIRFTEK